MSGQDPIDEVGEETFPASDAPPFSGVHAGVPGQHGLRVLIDLPPESPDVGYFRGALARFDGQVAFVFADAAGRSEERRVGKECTVLCRSRWSPYH